MLDPLHWRHLTGKEGGEEAPSEIPRTFPALAGAGLSLLGATRLSADGRPAGHGGVAGGALPKEERRLGLTDLRPGEEGTVGCSRLPTLSFCYRTGLRESHVCRNMVPDHGDGERQESPIPLAEQRRTVHPQLLGYTVWS